MSEDELRARLASAQRTIAALCSRIEQYQASSIARDREAIFHAMAHLEAIVDQRTRDLASSENRYRTLFDASPDLLVTVDDRGVITSTNETLRLALDDGDEVVGRPLASLFEPDSAELVRQRMQLVLDRDDEIELVLRDGRRVTCSGARIEEADASYLVAIRDITARQALEAALQNARRLASLGQLAAGVAHEINNPLAVIQGRAELALLEREALPPSTRSALETVVQHAERIGRIVRNLRAIAGQGTAERESVLLGELIDGAIDTCRRPIELHLETTARLLRVDVSRWQLERALANLFQSAPDGTSEPARVEMYAYSEDDRVHLTVRDHGPPIDPGVLDDALLEERTDSLRSELGLSISWGILHEHESNLEIENVHEGGVVFRFSLPESPRSLDEDPVPLPRRVLVVEDETILARNVAALLAASGYESTHVATAEEAMQILTAGWACVLADVRLPGTSGHELYEYIRRNHPVLARRVVLMSGLFQDAPEGVAYLQKPFRGPALIAAVEQAAQR